MRRIRRLLVGLLAFALACGVPEDENATFEEPDDVPFGLLDPPTTTAPDDGGNQQPTALAALCFVRDDMVAIVERSAPADLTLTDVFELLVAGPSAAERSGGMSTALSEDVVVERVEASHGVAEVDLDAAFSDESGHRQLLAVAQIVCTLTARPGVGQVTFTLDGEPVDVPRGRRLHHRRTRRPR